METTSQRPCAIGSRAHPNDCHLFGLITENGRTQFNEMGPHWLRWVIISWLLTIATVRAQNDVGDHHQEHNEFGCDCMEYWTCITR